MRTTKRIIIRIIVAVAVAVILSKLKLLNIIDVSAKTTTDVFTYSNVLIDSTSKTLTFSNNFAKDFNYGSLKTNVAITTNIVTSQTPTVLRQATVLNGGINEVCKIGSLQEGTLFSLPTSGTFNGYNLSSQTYSIECNLKPNSTITSMTLYFSGSLNQSFLSFGPYATFKEDDMLLETKKQNETCFPSKNILSPDNIVSGGYSIANGGFFSSTGSIATRNKIEIDNSKNYVFSLSSLSSIDFMYVLYYDSNNNYLGYVSSSLTNGIIKLNTFNNYSNVKYINLRIDTTLSNVRDIQLEEGSSKTNYEEYGEICKSKQDILLDEQKEQTKQQQETNDLIKNDNVDDANSQGSSFFNDFDSNTPSGLSGIISSPLRLLTAISSSSCSPLTFPLPFVNENVSIPCMSSIYQQHFSSFLSIYQIITTGLIGYWVCINLFRIVKGLQNPENDRIEVLDL